MKKKAIVVLSIIILIIGIISIIKYNKKGSGRQYKAPSWGVSGHWRTLPDGREIHSVLQ